MRNSVEVRIREDGRNRENPSWTSMGSKARIAESTRTLSGSMKRQNGQGEGKKTDRTNL